MAKLQKQLDARIYELREKSGLTQAQLAEKANVSNDTISRIERGIKSPSFEVLERLAKALDIESGSCSISQTALSSRINAPSNSSSY